MTKNRRRKGVLEQIRRTPGSFPRGVFSKFKVKGTCIFIKGLEQRRIQPRTGAKVEILPALAGLNVATEPPQALVDWSQDGQHHHRSILHLDGGLWFFSSSVVSNSLQSHGLQQTRLPCPSPSPGVRTNSCPLSRWCHPTISSSVAPCPSPCALNISQHQSLCFELFLSKKHFVPWRWRITLHKTWHLAW